MAIKTFRVNLGATAGALAMTFAASLAPVYAQDASPQSDEQTTTGEAFGGDIVVTAQRRNERLRDVPISIAALSSEAMDQRRVTSIADLTNAVPGLVVTAGGTAVQPSIRGISTSVGVPGAENNIAIYVDGVYQVVPASSNFQFADIERIEVLKGPQGTLFGRNASGGAISIVTREPSFTATGKLEANYGSFNELRARGFVSAPLNDMIAFSISGLYAHSDGYYNDRLRGGRTGGLDTRAVQGRLLIRPSDSFDMLFTASHIDNDDPGQLTYQPFMGHAPNNTTTPLPTRPWDVAPDTLPVMETSISTFALRARYMADDFTITSHTSYTKPRTRSLTDADSGPQVGSLTDVIQNATSFQQELQVATDFDGRINFVAGVFYLKSDHDFDPALVTGPTGATLFRISTNVGTNALAAFGEANVKLTDQLTLIAGLRYSWEEKVLTGAIGPAGTPRPEVGRESWDAFTPRISVKYDIAPNSNIYFTYSKGFKSGAWDSTGLSRVPIEPETLDAFEIGAKSRLTDWLDIDAAAFHYNAKNLQVQIINGLVSSIENAAAANIKGVDFNATAKVSSDLNFVVGVAWLDAKYTDFNQASALFWNPIQRRNVSTSVNATGNQLIRSPEWTLSGLANYNRAIGSGTFDASLSVYYSSSFSHVPANNVRQNAFATIDALAGYTLQNGLRLGVWGKNLTNQAIALAVLQNGVADRISYRAPRSFGGMISFAF